MNECVFCKIVDGNIPSQKIGENTKAIAILDIHPNTKGHALIIPRHHAQNARDLKLRPPKIVLSLIEFAEKYLSREGKAELFSKGYLSMYDGLTGK